MNKSFSGRDFGGATIEGYQVRVPIHPIAVRPPWTKAELFLNPNCRYALSSSGFMWPSALLREDERELVDPSIGLIPEERLGLALHAVIPEECEILFLRLIGMSRPPRDALGRRSARDSINSRMINLAVPSGFEFRGFEVTNGWWGASPISAQGQDEESWKELRSIADGHVNEWNLIDDFAVAHELARVCTARDPREGAFRAVLFAIATPERKRCFAR